jgi:hypothetical protein
MDMATNLNVNEFLEALGQVDFHTNATLWHGAKTYFSLFTVMIPSQFFAWNH